LLEKSIAVLPFENRSEDKANAYFADGIQDEILTRLAKIGALKVISRTSTQTYKSAPANLREVGRQLGVANVLEGSVQKIANDVLVNVQLIRVATDEQVIGVDVMRARVLVDLDRLDEATEALRRWEADPRMPLDPALESMYWHERASLAAKLFRLDDALAFERTALRSCGGDKEHGQRANVARALMSVGTFIEAEQLIRASLAVSSETTNHVFYANQLAIMADVLLGRGKLAEAEQRCLQSLATRREIGVAGFIASSLLCHGWLLELQGRGGDAAAVYCEALELRRGLRDWKAEFPAHAIRVALAAGDVAAATAALSQCEARTPTSNQDRLLCGELRLAQGDPVGAIGPFEQVVVAARNALAACDRNTAVGRQLVVALCGLVAAGDDHHDVIAEIARFRSKIDSVGPIVELRHQLRVLHRYDRTGRSTSILERCNAML
jgi:tetratricopeptide (TPR) repeat protein